jgi:ABC-2 type transport system ATP-binding protein
LLQKIQKNKTFMSIIISQLTKQYGPQKAIDAISFEVKKGDIIGFLGPNGAGKSTTMKITTGYLAATSGTVSVNGVEVHQDPIAVKKMIGYLPEHNPLYLDMYVKEFLGFMGSLFGLKGKQLDNRVAEVIAMVGLEPEQHKKIEQLSKGYRQRVGLAHALIHDPEILILDEPMTGLDPNQILEIRKLIQEIGRNKTVVFSTHIMQEVEAICNRVVIINRGKIVADDSLANLKNENQNLEETFRSLTNG